MGAGRDSFEEWSKYLATVPVEYPRKEYRRDQYWIDVLPEKLVLPLKAAIEAAPPLEDWTAPDVTPALLDEAMLREIMKEHRFRALDEPTIGAYHGVIQWLKWRVAEVIGAPWAVLNVRSWTTGSGVHERGPNKWHRDGMPKDMLKLMIYLTSIGGEGGGLEMGVDDQTIRRVEGPAGTWVLFQNSILKHRGLAPTAEGAVRVASELTLIPAREFDLAPRSLGFNARHPLSPPPRPPVS